VSKLGRLLSRLWWRLWPHACPGMTRYGGGSATFTSGGGGSVEGWVHVPRSGADIPDYPVYWLCGRCGRSLGKA